MSDRLYVNPWRFKAWGSRGVTLGAINGRTIADSATVAAFRVHNATVDRRLVERAGLEWLATDNFLRPTPLDLEHPYAPELGFFSLWPGSADERLDRLQRASVGVLGVGTLGSQVAHLLAAAGVGHLVLCDKDTVEIRNLNRQFYDCADLGRAKVDAAAERLRRLRPEIRIDRVNCEVTTAREVESAVAGVDFVVRAIDTPVLAAFEVDLAARRLGVPHVGGGFIETWAAAGPLTLPGRPCLRCLTAPPEVEMAEDRRVPTFAPLSFWLSATVGGDVLRHLADLGEPLLLERMVMMDWATGQMRDERIRPLPERCPACGAGGDRPASIAVASGRSPRPAPGIEVRAGDGIAGDGGRNPGWSGDPPASRQLIGVSALLVALSAALATLLLLSAPLPERLGVMLVAELAAGALGALALRPVSVVNGYLWGAMWGLGTTAVGAVQAVLGTAALMARPFTGLAAVLVALPIDVLLISAFGLSAAWATCRLTRNFNGRLWSR
jgi:molybdopterin/thiamine biosynthesis adenylyltransferase